MMYATLKFRLASNFVFFALILIVCFSAQAADIDESSIAEPVAILHDTLLANMKQGSKLSFDERYDALFPVVDSRFDTALIAKVVIGRYWKTLAENEKQDFIALFQQLTVSTYASRFNSYNDHVFKQKSIEQMKRQRYLVRTTLLVPGDEPVPLDYIVHQVQGNWKIISVIAKGINDLSLKRAEYAAVIKDKGFAALNADIKAKISELRDK